MAAVAHLCMQLAGFVQALRENGCVVADMDQAQLVFVDFYCPYISWLGYVHYSKASLEETPAHDILLVGGHFRPS